MKITDIRSELFKLSDGKYREFQAGLIPSVPKDRMIGVRTPQLKDLAKRLYKTGDTDAFLNDLPHEYFDEDQLHAFIISEEKDPALCLALTERFLPYIDNWATCDQLSPTVFKKNKKDLEERAKKWIASGETYSVRFGIGMLMQHFLDEDFKTEHAETVADIRSEEYYVNMMRAWYFATALAKQYDAVIPFLENGRLDAWTNNKAVQKAVESRRISSETKEYLKTLKRK
ncbi:MAG: DNA alkylation repair protein [Firmicutes bacterium]|nr:DNA alkylation repair protein [Bacillota bacterium]